MLKLLCWISDERHYFVGTQTLRIDITEVTFQQVLEQQADCVTLITAHAATIVALSGRSLPRQARASTETWIATIHDAHRRNILGALGLQVCALQFRLCP